MKPLIISICLALFFISCKNQITNKDQQRKQNDLQNKPFSPQSSLNHYDIENESPNIVKLPEALYEISGICFNAQGRMFAHGDEDADMFEIDPKTGKIIKAFYVGDPTKGGKHESIKGDFEDIAIVGDRFFLMNSKGIILEFKEGNEGEHVEYKEYPTKLTAENNVEGLCYDSETNSLLLCCKDSPGEGYEKMRAVYSFSLSSMSLDDKPRFLISIKEIKKGSIESEFNPSAIIRNSQTGTFYIIAARGNLIIEISKTGEILGQKSLPESVHTQPEGIAIDKDMTLYISNEGKDSKARMVSYPYIP